jgi:hypothetical protein
MTAGGSLQACLQHGHVAVVKVLGRQAKDAVRELQMEVGSEADRDDGPRSVVRQSTPHIVVVPAMICSTCPVPHGSGPPCQPPT